MLTLRPFSRGIEAGGLGRNHCHFHCARGFATPVLAHMLDSLVRVSRRGKENHFVQLGYDSRQQHGSNYPGAFPAVPTKSDQRRPQRPTRKRAGKYGQAHTGFLRFLFSNFRYSLTLFSKFFASFPHGTCTLSVSHQYLALDGIYHPLRAAIPNNSTRFRSLQRPGGRESHPLGCPVPRDLARPITQTDHNSANRFTLRALPASVALTEGILVSFFSSA